MESVGSVQPHSFASLSHFANPHFHYPNAVCVTRSVVVSSNGRRDEHNLQLYMACDALNLSTLCCDCSVCVLG